MTVLSSCDAQVHNRDIMEFDVVKGKRKAKTNSGHYSQKYR